MENETRVRFAPSPTGPLHIGGVRTALYNYLFAKQNKGAFILRIEDTDQSRYVENSERYILDALTWCGLRFDEGPGIGGDAGPYRQSERKSLYKKYADALVVSGNAYYAFDTPGELDKMRASMEADGKTFVYNWESRGHLRNSLSLSETEVRDYLAGDMPYVIRFKIPTDEVLNLHDRIRGDVRIDSNILDDKILFKSDGMPTYHLANVVDDHLMRISHVIRGEEWLPSLALHTLLYRAFGWECPDFAHLPLIMKPEGKGKLSKRDGEKLGFPVYPLEWGGAKGYRESGYLPEAVINFLAMLGWNPGTEKEIFSLGELISSFTLERVNKSGARFDPDKTKWYNQQYLQMKTAEELASLFEPFLEEQLEKCDENKLAQGLHTPGYVARAVELLRERAYLLTDFWESGDYLFIRPGTYEDKAVKKHWKPETPRLLSAISAVVEALPEFSAVAIEQGVKEWIQAEGTGFGKVMAPLRLALVGDLKGPHIFDIMSLLGKGECLARIRVAMESLSPPREAGS